ncbi:MAG: hypothetical protein CMO01_26720 [Thalassobius sp.]|nr:hypothetical protein [Thalassovita sp.]
MKRYPPKWIDSLLEALLKERFADEIIGDLHEWFEWKSESQSAVKLYFGYLKAVLMAFRLHNFKNVKTLFLLVIDTLMIHNNIKISVRSLLQHRLFTVINLLGLTISLMSFLFIYAFVSYEISYDNFHSKGENIYRVLQYNPESKNLVRSTPTPLADAFLTDFESSMEFARFGNDPVFVELDSQKYYEENFYWADSSMFNVFDLPFIYGDPKHALTEKNTVVLTEEVSNKYFGEGVNPVGKLLPIKIYDGNANITMRIDGVMKSLPSNTDLPFEVLGSISNAYELYSRFNKHWGFNWLHTYVYIPNKADVARIELQFPNIIERALGPEFVAQRSFYFQPLNKVHLYSTEVSGANAETSIDNIITFVIIGIFIILIATINYLNLMGARVNKRTKEVGVRKVLGASKKQLLVQFLTESNITLFLSMLMGITLVYLLWPVFINFLAKPIPFSILVTKESVSLFIALIFVCGTLAGSYPAWLLTSVSVSKMINKQANNRRKNNLQKVLVSFQFAVSVFLIISSVIVYRQVDFMSHKNLGFNQEQLLTIKVEDRATQEKIKLIKEEIAKLSAVQAVTVSGESLPSQMNNTGSLAWDEASRLNKKSIHVVSIDQDFFGTLEIPFLYGENFVRESDFGAESQVIINKAAMDIMGGENPVKTMIEIDDTRHEVIGVVDNYHYQSLLSSVIPVVFCTVPPGSRLSPDNIIVRLKTDDVFSTLDDIETIWKNFSPDEYFSFQFVDETYQAVYNSERRFLKLFSIFAALSIIISCMGLYGIVLFTTEEKSKEISIRKVLGSTVPQIVLLVVRKFMLLILIGFAVGIPLSIYFMNDWLQQFSYRIEVDFISVLLAGSLVSLVAAFTIGFNTLKAALANPIVHLRKE